MFRIGEFSKLTQVSIRMLRYYDEVGILKPAEVDKWTGHRLYSVEQIPRQIKSCIYGIGLKNTLTVQIEEILIRELICSWMGGVGNADLWKGSESVSGISGWWSSVWGGLDQPRLYIDGMGTQPEWLVQRRNTENPGGFTEHLVGYIC